ncbi:TadG family pilus assembly protein [Comamonas terrigena]|uniref:TadG family pilus assembly protein n=1 Tax=Comamonas terrigena TaxID=32013 RepID=UPI002448F4DA|nr:TadG family pilus assembly protein [Comamonas terrigena]MDH1701324.1 hypothetical protein [Comamonas terrigena]
MNLSLHRAQKGAVALVAALWMGVALSCLMALDIGNLFWQQRELQKMADLAAVAGAADSVNTCASLAAASAASNGRAGTDSLQVQHGHWQPNASGQRASYFVAGAATVVNACRVTVQRTVPYFFVWPAADGGRRSLQATATAVQRPQLARLSVRSKLAVIQNNNDALLLNALVGGLLGGKVDISVLGWNGLLGTQIDLLAFLDTLALKVGIDAGDYDRLLSTQISVNKVLEAMLDVVQRGATTADANVQALQSLAGVAATVPGVRLQLNQLLKLQSGLTASALSTSLNVLELAQAVIQVGNGNNAAAAAVDIPLGIADTSLRLKVLQPPQLTAIGDPALAKADPLGADRLFVRTAQVRALISVDLPLVGATITALNALLKLISPAVALVNFLTGGGSGYADLELLPAPSRVDVLVEAGGGQVYLTDYVCTPTGKALVQTVRTSAADIRVGRLGLTANEAAQKAFASNAPVVMQPLPVLDIGCWGCDGVGKRTAQYFGGLGLKLDTPVASKQVAGFQLLQPPRLDQAAVWGGIQTDNVVQSLNNTLGSLSGLTTLPADPRASQAGIQGILKLVDDILAGLLSLVGSLIAGVLAPVLDPLVNSLLRLLGIDLALTEVGGQLNCGGAAELVY